jgi:hypothetical protein
MLLNVPMKLRVNARKRQVAIPPAKSVPTGPFKDAVFKENL